MKFTLPVPEDLRELTEWAGQAIPARPVVPVLATVHLTVTDDGEVQAGGFDYEHTAAGSIRVGVATGFEAGHAFVSAKKLHSILSELPTAKPLAIRLDEEKAVLDIDCGRFSCQLPTTPGDEYPDPPALPDAEWIVDGEQLATAIRRVAFAAGKDDTLPALTGILIILDDSELSLIATDRYRLAYATVPYIKAPVDGETTTIVVSAKHLDKWQKTCPPGEKISLSISHTPLGDGDAEGAPNRLGLSATGRSVTFAAIGAEYPNWQRFFDGDRPFKLTVKVDDLLPALGRAAKILAGQKNKTVRLDVTPDTLTLIADGGEGETSCEEVDCTYRGDEMTLLFNAEYLISATSATTADVSDDVVITFTENANKPARMTSTAPADDYSVIQMPIRPGTS